MRIRSEIYKEVFYEKWQTPISHGLFVWLWGIVQTQAHTHFFFTVDSEKDCHVMTIGRRWPMRLTDEDYASCIRKYFRDAPIKRKKPKRQPLRPFRTWKMWGTNYIKELDEGHALSDYKKPRDKKIFSYLIVTQDEWIEMVLSEPEWKVFRNTRAKKVMQSYLNKY